jgi:general secretion pathway protein H
MTRRSQTGRGSGGFTMIELLVVIFIIAILATLVSLSIGNRALDDRLAVESQRLDQLVRMAMDESEMLGMPIGLRFTDSGYQFVTLDDKGRWTAYDTDGTFRSRKYQPPFYAQIHVDGQMVPPAQDQAAGSAQSGGNSKSGGSILGGDDKNKLQPQILLMPGGESSDFTVDLLAPNYPVYYRIAADSLGHLTSTRGLIQ